MREIMLQNTLHVQYYHHSTFNPMVLNVNFLNLMLILPLRRGMHEVMLQSTLYVQYYHHSTFNSMVLNVNFLISVNF